jgi:mono/diheme cytochrome c family protein
MARVLKWLAVGLAGLVGVVLVAGFVLYVRGGSRLNRTYAISAEPVQVPSEDASVEHGRHLAEAVTLCTACHGADLSGGPIIDEPMIATAFASNLTAGRGGIATSYTDADFVRAIRNGVNPAGRGLMIMHSDAYNRLSAADLGAIIAYVRSVPAVDKEVPPTRTAPLGRVFVALGLFDSGTIPLIPAEVIDHAAPVPEAPEPGVTPEYGRYLASIALCAMCHGGDLRGGPPIEAGAPPGPDIVATTAPGGWSAAQFLNTIRTGVTPYGKALNGEVMPWEVYAKMTDDELRAIRRYLESLRDDTMP